MQWKRGTCRGGEGVGQTRVWRKGERGKTSTVAAVKTACTTGQSFSKRGRREKEWEKLSKVVFLYSTQELYIEDEVIL
jgi:hypothetical protein